MCQFLKMTEHLGEKKLKAVRRAQKAAARAYRAQIDGTQVSASPAGSTEPVAVERFLQAYGELTDATAELYRRLDPEDPRHAHVREALAHARRVVASVLTPVDAGGDADPAPDADSDTAAVRMATPSLELVRVRPAPELRTAPNLPTLVRRRPARMLPDQAALVRYARVHRATHRWPDEAALFRYLRARPLPDESALHRFIQRRRELYQLYA
jgi:hypothetical protein